MKRRTRLSVIAALAITVFLPPFPAYSGSFFDRFFGQSEDPATPPPPEVTLQAPFPTTQPQESTEGQSKLMDIYGVSDSVSADPSDLSKPHRNEKQVIQWTTDIVSQAMTINPRTYNSDFQKISDFFTPYALQEYQEYLKKMDMMNVLSSNSFKLQSISDEEGSVIKAGPIGDTYHWLLQIPVMSSFYKDDLEKVDKSSAPQSQNLIVQVQVGRIRPKQSEDIGLVVERWLVSSHPKR